MSNTSPIYHEKIKKNKRNRLLMAVSKLLIPGALILLPTVVLSAEISINELSNGACWYQQSDEVIKFVSFNEKRSQAITQKTLDSFNYSEIMKRSGAQKDLPYQALGLSLHCGGDGGSLVIKSKVGDVNYCSWIGLAENGLKVRSIGGLEATSKESTLCDGYKNLELIVGLVNKEQAHEFFEGNLLPVIKAVHYISETTVKIVLEDQYYGKEDEAIDELKKTMSLKYIEYNLIQHQVGESVSLK